MRSTAEAIATVDREELEAGEHEVIVYAPSAGRCGRSSEPRVLVVE